jgi:hypothetical protein
MAARLPAGRAPEEVHNAILFLVRQRKNARKPDDPPKA